MDAMWHDNSGTATADMVKFTHKGYYIVNPWMDEKTQKAVDPYKYYGERRTEQFIDEAIRTIQHNREIARQDCRQLVSILFQYRI